MRMFAHVLLSFLIVAFTWRGGLSTCVLDSDFGFTLNCQFKKSSIFRVRNLGGVKGYVGVGFSLGDELGFRQSLSNVEGNKRRSTARSTGLSAYATPDASDNSLSKKIYQNDGKASTAVSGIPPFKPIPPRGGSTLLEPIVTGPIPIAPVPIANQTAPVPAFQGLPSSITTSTVPKAPEVFRNALQMATSNFQIDLSGPQVLTVVPSPPIDRISSGSSGKLLPTAIPVSNSIKPEKEKPQKSPPEVFTTGLMADTVKKLAQATNLSTEAVAAAINIKQQQLMQQQKPPKVVTASTERPTTESVKKYPLAEPGRVMNAPKEYYPVGYDKNFDDNFVSRVELPDTSFYCGEQKHFPGLYADEDLGCMVFHVCAFTDDGLIMKSFLCPESTLFDQSILKCNWWFYVDCKASKKLYDSNIPISKSYQLMKALTFFSAYGKQR